MNPACGRSFDYYPSRKLGKYCSEPCRIEALKARPSLWRNTERRRRLRMEAAE